MHSDSNTRSTPEYGTHHVLENGFTRGALEELGSISHGAGDSDLHSNQPFFPV